MHLLLCYCVVAKMFVRLQIHSLFPEVAAKYHNIMYMFINYPSPQKYASTMSLE